MNPITAAAGGVRLTIHVQPRASRTEVVGLHGDAVKLRIAAPPVDGAANEEVVRFLAEVFHLPRRQVAITEGFMSRRKVIDATGISVTQATAALGL